MKKAVGLLFALGGSMFLTAAPASAKTAKTPKACLAALRQAEFIARSNDDVSRAIADLFAQASEDYRALSPQATSFHEQFTALIADMTEFKEKAQQANEGVAPHLVAFNKQKAKCRAKA